MVDCSHAEITHKLILMSFVSAPLANKGLKVDIWTLVLG